MKNKIIYTITYMSLIITISLAIYILWNTIETLQGIPVNKSIADTMAAAFIVGYIANKIMVKIMSEKESDEFENIFRQRLEDIFDKGRLCGKIELLEHMLSKDGWNQCQRHILEEWLKEVKGKLKQSK